jgi:dienelactone hydrolase
MTRKVVFALWMVFIPVALTSCVSTAVFKSLDTNKTGEQQILRGKLTKPFGDGPFPAIVLLHGASGPKSIYSDWFDRLRRWGFLTLMVDSFGPRGISNIAAPGKYHIVHPYRRAKDAHGAKLYLESLPFVDPNRIAVMGWSHGGMSTLEALAINEPSSSPFQAAIAYYPYCTPLYIVNSPLLVLIGEKDDWTPANLCEFYIKSKKGWPEINLKVYPDAHHAFDQPLRLNYYMGHMVGRNSSAASDSYERVRAFLEKYLMDH